jgi:hypothetical protein
MKLLLSLLLLSMTCTATGAECPVKQTLAYSRETMSGIPGPNTSAGSSKPINVSYFIYVVLAKGSVPSATGVWIEGRFYDATLQRVESPVQVERDTAVSTGEMDTLVARTSDDVYRVDPGEEKTWSPAGETETKRTQGNQVVVFLKVGRATCYGVAKEIKALRPAPGM